MGMYTEIRTDFVLSKDAPEQVRKTLLVMAGLDPEFGVTRRAHYDHGQTHELFKTARWEVMLTMGSFYFDDEPQVVTNEVESGLHFTSVSNLKDYDGEIHKFADWIRPYVVPQDTPYVTSVYEEFPEEATRYFTSGRIDKFDLYSGEVFHVLQQG